VRSLSDRGREGHFDGEATFGAGVRGEGGVVGAGDGVDDGEAQSVAVGVGVAGALVGEAGAASG
jgi:hypothetical protein